MGGGAAAPLSVRKPGAECDKGSETGKLHGTLHQEETGQNAHSPRSPRVADVAFGFFFLCFSNFPSILW